jgi:hypothetical protein
MSNGARESLGLHISCCGSIAFIAGFEWLHSWLTNAIGFILYLGFVLSVIFFVIAMLRDGRSLTLALFVLLIVGILVFGSIFGILWYFTSYMPSNPSMFEFKFPEITPRSTMTPMITVISRPAATTRPSATRVPTTTKHP